MKRLLSVVLALMILMSTMVTGLTVGAASTDKATINGKEVAVGSKVTYKLDLKTSSAIEAVEGVVKYDSSILEVSSFTMPNTTTNLLTNTNIAGEIYYSAYGIDENAFDFSSEKNYFTAVFTVVSAGTCNTTHEWSVLDDTDDKTLLNGSGQVDTSKVTATYETTVSGSTIPSDTAIINGVSCKVGSTITFNVKLKSASLIEDYQGHIFYTNSLLEPQSISCKYNGAPAMTNLADENSYPGKNIVSYTWTDFQHPTDFTTEDNLASVVFKVTASGEGEITSFIACIDDTNSEYIVLDDEILDSNVTLDTEVIPSEVPTTTTTNPTPSKTTFNGKEVSVGDEITVDYYIQADKVCEDFQGYFYYGNNTTGDTDGIEILSMTLKDMPGTMTNTAPAGKAAFTGTSFQDPYDFTTKTKFVSATFKITKANAEYFANAEMYILTAADGMEYANLGVVKNPFTWTQDSSQVTTTTKPTTNTTTITTAPPSDEYAVINGVKCKVGSTVTYNMLLKTDYLVEDYQAYVLYSEDLLEPQSLYCRETSNTAFTNLADTKHYPGRSVVAFNWLDIVNHLDFSTETVIASVKFTVTAAGTGTIEDDFIRIDDPNDVIILKNNQVTSDGTTYRTETIAEEVPTTTTKPTETTTTKPTPTKTTFNGKEVKVGDEVTATYYIQTEKLCEDFQGHFYYGNNTKNNTDGIELKSFYIADLPGLMNNTGNAGDIIFTGVSPMNPYDFTSKMKFISATFKITEENCDYFANASFEVLSAVDGTNYVNFSQIENEFVWELETTVPTTTTTTTAKTEPTTTTTKPAPATYEITNNLINVVSSNNATTIKAGETYTAVLSPEKNHKISTVLLVVNGSVVPVSANNDGTYTISVVATGNISVSAIANEIETEPTTTKPSETTTTKPTPATYKISNNLTNVVTSNNATTINEGETYKAVLSPAKDHKIVAVVLVVNGENVPVSANQDGTYTINVVATGDIVISAFANAVEPDPTTTTTKPSETTKPDETTTTVKKTYSVTYALTDVVSTSVDKTVEEGSTYNTILAPSDGYEIISVIATVGGQAITPTKSGNVYILSTKATGDIVIMAVAQKIVTTTTKPEPTTTKPEPTTTSVKKTYSVNSLLTNVISTNVDKTAEEGSTYSTILAPADGYEIVTVVATVGGQTITPTKSGNAYLITAKVTGDVNIIAVAQQIVTTTTKPEPTTTKPVATSESIPTTDPTEVIEINKISLNKSTATVKEGEKINLVASIWPGYTTEKTVTWSVNNSRIGVVSQTKNTVEGLYDNEGKSYCTETATFTAKASGQVVVKAVSNTGLVAKCVITVKTVATSLSVNKTSVTINNGKSATVKATVGPNSISSEYKGVSWTTSNKKVATVSSSGVIKGVGKGTCYVTATSKDNTSLSKKIKVTVKQPVTSVKFNKSSINLAKKNASTKVKATVSPSNANTKKLTIKSENTKIAKVSKSSVNSGTAFKVTAVKKGTTYVRATATDGSKKYARVKVTVKK